MAIPGDEVAAGQHRLCARGTHQRDAAARASADRDARPLPRGRHDPHRVVDHFVIDGDRRSGTLQFQQLAGTEHTRHLAQVEIAGSAAAGDRGHHALLVLQLRVVDQHLQQEAVQLCFRQRVGAFLLQRVLRGQRHEGRRQGEGLALDGYLAFLHHFQQGRLGLGRGTVDLVGQQQVGEHRAAPDLEALALRVVHRVAADVAGHQVGGELHAPVVQLQGLCQCAHQQGLAQPGHALDQHVATGQQRHQDLVQYIGLADEGVSNGGADGIDAFDQAGVGGRRQLGDFGHSRDLIWSSKRMRSRRAEESCGGGGVSALATRPCGHFSSSAMV